MVPVLSVSLLLFFSAWLHGRTPGLTAFCATVAVWSGALLLSFAPGAEEVGRRLAAVGAFVSAGYIHAVYDYLGRTRLRLVGLAYVVAAVLTAIGVGYPGVLYDPVSLSAGPMFWPGMGAAMVAAVVPIVALFREPAGVTHRWVLIASGALLFVGAWTNAVLLAFGQLQPWGVLAMLAALLLITQVVVDQQGAAARRLLSRSLLYAALAALLSAGFLFGVSWLLVTEDGAASYQGGAFFLLVMAALAVEPLRQHILERVGRRIAPTRVADSELGSALSDAETRADQAERLAELGTLTSAVAHEIRNPLGVISAHLKLLQRTSDSPHLHAISAQMERARHFADDLLAYGRPARLSIRRLDLSAVARLSWSTARSALAELAAPVELRDALPETGPHVEGDAIQLSQLGVILLENAVLAGAPWVELSAGEADGRAWLRVADGGPGVSASVADHMFEAFVTGRKREGKHAGTGLGLAIARRIAERHDGTLEWVPSEAGAVFTLTLPTMSRKPPQEAE